MTTRTHRPSPAAPPPAFGPDDSGLVDLRALRALQGLDAGPGVDRSGLRAIGGAAPGLEPSSLAPPVLAAREPADRGVLVAGLSAGAILMAGAVIAAAIWFAPARVAPPPTVAAPMPAPAPTGVGDVARAADGEARGDGTGDTPERVVAVGAGHGDPPTEDEATYEIDAAAPPKPASAPRTARRAPRVQPRVIAPPATPEPAPARAESLVETDRIIDLVDRALTDDRGTAAAATVARQALPETPDRGAVARALRAVEDRVKACAEGASGILWTKLTVEGATGRVARTLVTGEFAGTPAGACAARAVRDVQLPRFARATMDVRFPFPL